MKKIVHKAKTRGFADHGWLKSHHTFSFANYFDPHRMGFGALRVLNDDGVAPSRGFETHPHENMEIISVPLSGSLEHKDTMGNVHIIKKGDIQVMSAGTGLKHSEYNHSEHDDVNFLQIWVIPKKLGIEPNYSQKEFSQADRKNNFQLIVSPDGRDSSVEINQDAYFSLVKLEKDAALTYTKNERDHGVYLFIIDGSIEVEGEDLDKRDGLGLEGADQVQIQSKDDSEVLVMEVPMNTEGRL